MSLRFIIGRAGSGKTYICLEEIRHKLREQPDGDPLFFIVPEQATFQTELALAGGTGLQGTIRAQVLSFRRLAWRVLQEVGGAARRHIGELGKHMALRQILEENKEQLQAFQKTAEQPGFAGCLAEMISECKKFRVSVEQLCRVSGQLAPSPSEKLLQKKLEDLALLYQQFETFLGECYTDPEDYLTLLAEKMAGVREINKTEVWIDGFSGFTPQELLVIERLLVHCRQVNIALCLDKEAMDQFLEEDHLFYPVWETYRKILQLAWEQGVEVKPPLLLNEEILPRFDQAPVLAHLEKHFFAHPTVKWEEDPHRVNLVAAANRRAEVEGTARKIIGLCREEGYRWREISVVVRDLTQYGELISAVFRDFQIPCFIDLKRPVLHYPVVELIRSALEVMLDNWTYDPVFRYLKTDLVPVTRDEIDILENYVLAHGIKGSRWCDDRPWTYWRWHTLGEDVEPDAEDKEGLAKINRIREKACRHLKDFVQKISDAAQVRDICFAIYDLLDGLKVADSLAEWEKKARESGQLDLALEYAQVWNAVLNLLDQLTETMGQLSITPENFLKLLETGFDTLRLGLIPPGLDQVFVAGLDRSRNPNVRACFLLGVNEGVLPAKILDSGMFSAYDREILDREGCGLAPAGRRRLFEERYLTYIALTRSAEWLQVSYALADEEGRPLMPSPVVRRLKELLPDLQEVSCPLEPEGTGTEDLEFVSHPGHTLACLGTRLQAVKQGKPISPVWWDVYNFFIHRQTWQENIHRLIGGLFFSNREKLISSPLVRSLFGEKLRTSVSRLERFRACPFSHFASFGLKLREREEFALGAPDLGQFFHAALQMITEFLAREKRNWDGLSREECTALAERTVAELVPEIQNEILLSTARFRYLTGKLQESVSTAVYILSEHARRGEFRPLCWEVSFGPAGPLSSLKLDLEDGREMELVGRIDRIDAVSHEGKQYLRVIDYKSGRADWDLTDLFYGFKMQLLVYLHISLLNAVNLTGTEALPAGMLYFPVKNPLISAQGPLEPEDAKEQFLKKFKMAGMVLADPQAVKLMDREIKKYSFLIPVGMSGENNFYKNSSVVRPEDFPLLQKHLKELLETSARKIMDGLVEISPYRKGDVTSCRYCSYKPLCQFDLLLEGNRFRQIGNEKPEKIWDKLHQRNRGGKNSEQ